MKAIRTGNMTDQTYIQLEIALKQLQKQAYDLGQADLKEANQPPQGTDPDKGNAATLIQLFANSI